MGLVKKTNAANYKLSIDLFSCIRTHISGEEFDEKKCCPEKGCKSLFKYIEGFKNHLGQKHAYEEQMIQETVDGKSHPTTKNRFDFSVRYSHCGTDWAR
jgi:hypothetical protein